MKLIYILNTLFLPIIAMVVFLGCTAVEHVDGLVKSGFFYKTLHLSYSDKVTAVKFYKPYYISISYAPVYLFTGFSKDLSVLKVKPVLTPWADAWNKKEIVKQMDAILRQNKIESVNMRVKMIAHAVVASGWKQNVWNYNAWGVKQGAWNGNWYVMPTVEEDDHGNKIEIEHETWRSFNGWKEAIDDFKSRISSNSERPSYRLAYKHLVSDKISVSVAKGYWEALGSGNYYTARKFTGLRFARLCYTVRNYMD